MGLLSGTWRLAYSSAFTSGSLGGQRPGPAAALIPVTIGQVPCLPACLQRKPASISLHVVRCLLVCCPPAVMLRYSRVAWQGCSALFTPNLLVKLD